MPKTEIGGNGMNSLRRNAFNVFIECLVKIQTIFLYVWLLLSVYTCEEEDFEFYHLLGFPSVGVFRSDLYIYMS
jgi:hypothetical protein